jgi:23S rRNA (cytosine1962-C5)-methyltransferase
MLLETFKNFKDFELLDTGDGYRLEKWGSVILQRPDPQIIWQKSMPQDEWDKAWAIFESASGSDKGKWNIKKHIPSPWVIEFGEIKLVLKLSPFKHTGLFAEQAANWEWMSARLEISAGGGSASGGKDLRLKESNSNPKSKILNLFGYTGGATMVLAKAGCQVTHVDASKPAITWANENFKINDLPADSVRWILDDCVKFVKREVKRGAKYDGIIMDPPAFGHSPTGKTWKFNDDLPGLLEDCVQLLSPDAKFLIINGYATNSSAVALNNLLEDAIKDKPGRIEFGELCLKHPVKEIDSHGVKKTDRLISTGIFARWQV